MPNPTPDSSSSVPAARAGTPAAHLWERQALETVLLAAIKEQRAARRWRMFFRCVFLLVLALIAWALFAPDLGKSVASSRHTALISLNGEIAANNDASADNINAALRAAFADRATAGVILRIDSPGGSPVQAGMIYDEIRRLRRKHLDKPLYVVVDDMCASGGYYVAAAADKIFVDKASIVGSIGVRMDSFGFTGLMDKLGIERRMHTAGAYKGFYDPFSPESKAARAHAQEMLEQIHQQFVAAVKQGRGKRLKETPDIFSGLFWTGQQSVEMGLADGLGDTGYVARELIKASTIVDYTVKDSLTDRVARKFGTVLGGAALRALAPNARVELR